MVDPLMIPIVGLVTPIVLVPVILGMRQARIERQLEHVERLRALELGRTLPRDESWWSPVRLAAALGVGVPLGVFTIAWLACESLGFHPQVWISAGIVGLAGVIGGSLLAARHFAWRAGAEEDSVDAFGKPIVDPDAFDVVARRG